VHAPALNRTNGALGINRICSNLVDAGAQARFDLCVNISRHPACNANQKLLSSE